MSLKGRVLHLAFDAFGTLFRPSRPIAVQYREVANRLGIHGFSTDDLRKSFREAYKNQSASYPNYGRATDMKPSEWWAQIIESTFKPFLGSTQNLPVTLVPDLLKRFSSAEGYTLFDDVKPLFRDLRQLHSTRSATLSTQAIAWPYDHTIVSVVSNSDDRVSSILDSLGVATGDGTTDARNLELDVPLITLSYDAQVEKPDKRIFHIAETRALEMLAQTEVRPTNWSQIMVGDDLAKDYVAARNAGWHALHLDRDGNFLAFFDSPTTRICHLPRDRVLSAHAGSPIHSLPDDSDNVPVTRNLGAVLDFATHLAKS